MTSSTKRSTSSGTSSSGSSSGSSSSTTNRVALIGCGHIAAAHLAAWQQVQVRQSGKSTSKGKAKGRKASRLGYGTGNGEGHSEVVGVFDVSRELAEKRAREFGVARVFTSLDEAIEASDTLDVCTPPHTHADIAGKVLDARKHLLIEKPLVTSVADWEALRSKLATAEKSVLCVVHNLKFTHAVQQAKAWVDQGRIGDVIRLHRLYLTSPDDDRMLVGDKHWSHKLPGGRWFETLPHELYITHMFAGALELSSVTALHTRAALPGAPADEVCIVLAGERAISTVHYSASCKENRRSIEIFGTKGKIEIDVLSDTVTIAAAHDGRWQRAVGLKNMETGQRLLQAVPDRIRYAQRRVKKQTPHAAVIAAFDKHLAGEGPTPTPIDEVDYVVRNCDRVGREIDKAVARFQHEREDKRARVVV